MKYAINPLAWSDEHCFSWYMLLLIHLYLDNIASKCNRAASCLFVKQLALLWCGRQLLEIISSFFSLLSNFGFSFCSRGVTRLLVMLYALTHSSISR